MTCSDCPSPISVQSKTGRCRKCALAATNANPDVQHRKAEANRRKSRDPQWRAGATARLVRAGRRARTDPAFVEVLREAGRRNLVKAYTPEARAKWYAAKPEAGRKKTARYFAWCPPDRIEEYRFLTRKKHIAAAEAKRMILETLTPFERQMQRVREGANIVTVRPVPKSTHGFSLTGCSANF